MERERQGFFQSVDDAVKAGYVFLRVLVLGGRNLSPPLSPSEFAAEPELPNDGPSKDSSKKKVKQASRKLKNVLKTVINLRLGLWLCMSFIVSKRGIIPFIHRREEMI